jgi:AcrR family transcriptional regulator
MSALEQPGGDLIDFDTANASGNTRPARVRILQAFAERLRTEGIRQITMTNLASCLGMSKKTLYENFSNKEDVLSVVVDLWIDALQSRVDMAERQGESANSLVHDFALAHMDCIDRFSLSVWHELSQDYPVLHKRVVEAFARANRQTRMALQVYLRSDVAPRVAIETYLAVLARAADPEVCERLNMTRRELTVAALDIWSKGALQELNRPAAEAVNGEGSIRRIGDR